MFGENLPYHHDYNQYFEIMPIMPIMLEYGLEEAGSVAWFVAWALGWYLWLGWYLDAAVWLAYCGWHIVWHSCVRGMVVRCMA